ncbi:MAG: RNA degradosome polyphosphate kinase, partial [Candidatus Chloroheliales bacterium]
MAATADMKVREAELAIAMAEAKAESVAEANESARMAEELRDEAIKLKPNLYFNRELSLLKFQRRVLENSLSERHPLLERIKFLAITHSNIDEFFMVRVSGLREQIKQGVSDTSPDGMTPSEELATVRQELLDIFEQQASHWRDTLHPALEKAGITISDYKQLNHKQRRFAREYFDREVFPVCTPLAVDPGHPFPHISNLSLNLAVNLRDPDGRKHFARVKVPNVLPRLVQIPDEESSPTQTTFVWLEQLLIAHLDQLFPSMEIVEAHPFRVIRDADIEIQELEADDLLHTIEESLNRRRFGSAVALITNPTIPHHLWAMLMEKLELSVDEHYPISGPLGLSDLMEVYKLERLDLKDATFTPHVPAILRNRDIFSAIRDRDIILHHPFDSFNPVLDFIRTA